MTLTYADVDVEDKVYCLAWLGKQFTIVAKDERTGRVELEAESAVDPYGAQVDLFPETMWMLTDQPWDQIWYWPDRAGEHFDAVFNRWIGRHRVGQVVLGYLVDTGIAGVGDFLVPKPKLSMAFRVTSIDLSFAQVMVEPVVLADDPGRRELGPAEMNGPADRWLATGPRLPLRIGMNTYRWALSVGDIVLNWEDFTASIGNATGAPI
jgi:hypothetical protein